MLIAEISEMRKYGAVFPRMYGTGPIGAYSEVRNIPADKLVKIPEGVEDRTAAAIMLLVKACSNAACKQSKIASRSSPMPPCLTHQSPWSKP